MAVKSIVAEVEARAIKKVMVGLLKGTGPTQAKPAPANAVKLHTIATLA